MSKATIWAYLKQHTKLSEEAIAGVMGNFEAESNCESCRVQGDFSTDRHISKEYARQVNSGEISIAQFQHDSKGFGLAQWTFHSRKNALLNYCKSIGAGIEDEEAQLSFFLSEMESDFVGVWNQLLRANDIGVAADLVCRYYECPAVNNVAARPGYGKEIYNQFHGTGGNQGNQDKVSKVIELLEQILKVLRGE